MNQSLNELIINQSNLLTTFDTQLKTTLNGDEEDINEGNDSARNDSDGTENSKDDDQVEVNAYTLMFITPTSLLVPSKLGEV